jgi:hypothetical protein
MRNKFKFFCKRLDRFIHEYVLSIVFNMDGGLVSIKVEDDMCEDGEWIYYKDCDELIVLNCTGFKARNDQEVYDGDILLDLTYRDTPMYYVVSWSQTKGTWMLHRKDKESDGRVLAPMYQSFLAGGVTSELEVVGNIYMEKVNDE